MTLHEYLNLKGMTDAAFADLIGATQPTVFRLRKKGQIPSRDLMASIFNATNGAVTANDFFGLGIGKTPSRPTEQIKGAA